MTSVLAYPGPPAPGFAEVPVAWRVDPLVLAVVLIATLGYLAGVRRFTWRADACQWRGPACTSGSGWAAWWSP